MICKKCIHFKVCKHKSENVYECEHFADGTIKNQYDRIRNMSIEEMAESIQRMLTAHLNKYGEALGFDIVYLSAEETQRTVKEWVKWLEMEVTE